MIEVLEAINYFVVHIPYGMEKQLFLLLLFIGPRWLVPRMYCSHIGLLYHP